MVGGTGLYVKALTHGLSPLPASDPATRARLEAMDLAELLRELERVDLIAAAADRRQKQTPGGPGVGGDADKRNALFGHREAWTHSKYDEGKAGILLERDRKDLTERIDRQVDVMFEAGVVAEVRALNPGDIGPTAAGAIGLNPIREMVAGGSLKPGAANASRSVRVSTRSGK